ncbi:MAG: Gfo/Idh/MocA family oxidoreductase [Kiritimatiellae bacterium]|nr:Gfo/Idh/MocA family oxidoreductase [Kiritimatiellia bacterium]
MSAPVRVGVVGVGSLGEHHARIYASLPGATLAAIYDLDARRAETIAHRYGAYAAGSLDDFASRVEAASVVVPTDRHREVAVALLSRGLHLLVEKPIAATTAEAQEMVALAEARGCILQVGHVERFNPVLSVLEHAAGRPRFVEAHRLAPYPPGRPDGPPRGTEVSVILDLMIHDLEILLHLVRAPVAEIRAVGVPVLSPTEDIANVRLSFADGTIANVTASRISPERMRKIRVFYEQAYVSLDYLNQSGEIYRLDRGRIVREAVPIERGEPLRNELASFVDCVARHAEPVVDGRQAARALQLAIEIHRRLAEGPS